MSSAAIPIWSYAVWVAVATIVAAFIGGLLLRGLKISEFRQAWIIDLRQDVSDYIGAASKWFNKKREIDRLHDGDPEKIKRTDLEIEPLLVDAEVIRARIRMRINPDRNRHQIKDDEFLEAIDGLVRFNKFDASAHDAWKTAIALVIERSRDLFKREWQVTKGSWLRLLIPW